MDKGVRKAEAVWKANASSARETIGLCTIFPSLQQIKNKCSQTFRRIRSICSGQAAHGRYVLFPRPPADNRMERAAEGR